MSPNITIFEIVTPISPNKTKQSKNDVGIEKPTRRAALVPSEVSTTIITNAIAVKTDPSSCLTILSTTLLWSFDVPTSTAALRLVGQF
jgi:hypothetical protein